MATLTEQGIGVQYLHVFGQAKEIGAGLSQKQYCEEARNSQKLRRTRFELATFRSGVECSTVEPSPHCLESTQGIRNAIRELSQYMLNIFQYMSSTSTVVIMAFHLALHRTAMGPHSVAIKCLRATVQ